MAKLLVAAEDLPSGYDKGDIVEIKETGHDFGAKIGLPKFITIEITNRTEAQVKDRQQSWVIRWRVTEVEPPAGQEDRIGFKVEVDPNYISVSGLGADVKQEVRDGLLFQFDGRQEAATSNSLTFSTLQSNGHAVSDVDGYLADKFDDMQAISRYYIKPDSVDTVVGMGGALAATWNQVKNNVIDRLSE